MVVGDSELQLITYKMILEIEGSKLRCRGKFVKCGWLVRWEEAASKLDGISSRMAFGGLQRKKRVARPSK